MHKFLIHKRGDHMGVATQQIREGEAVIGVHMDDDSMVEVVAKADVPLGHKISVSSISEGSQVIEYGHQVGLSTASIQPGDYIHNHNIKSARW